MNKHTPGKWEACGTTVHAGKSMVANCEPYYTTKSGDTCEANARLIAATPDLLSACEYVVKWHRDNDGGDGALFGLDFVTTCIAAIRKAKGE